MSAAHNLGQAPTKIQRVLTGLLQRSFNRFEAERLLHDHALHSTVSSIQNGYGVTVARKMEKVPGFRGHPTHVARYWIAESEREAAERLLRRLGGPTW